VGPVVKPTAREGRSNGALVQILVVVANIQMSHTTLKAEVEKGSM